MKYYIIAGEASGDLHGSNLIRSLKIADESAIIRCWGGELMQNEGGELVKHYRDTAVMGIFEVLAKIRTIKANFDFCYSDILSFFPDVIILIDYPGFNLRVAKWAKARGIKVFYYISPKVWVWKESRVKQIKKYVDHMFVIFPFEKDFYKTRHNYDVDFVGNPLIDSIENQKKNICSRDEFISKNKLSDKPIIALLPGSRKSEIMKLLPIMTSVSEQFTDFQFVIAATSTFDETFYSKNSSNSNCSLVFNQTYSLLQHAHSAVVASGTATLETALFNIPQVVCYRVSTPTFVIGRMVVSIKFFSLVNIIMGKEVVKELLQFHLKRDITNELSKIVNDNEYRNHMIENYAALREKCGGEGASKRVAELMVNYLSK